MTLIEALDRGLLTDHEFCMLQDIDYFARAFEHGEMRVVQGRERTRYAGRCRICKMRGPGGLFKFYMKASRARGFDQGWRHFCAECLGRIHAAVVARFRPETANGPERAALGPDSGTVFGVPGCPPTA